jgi:PPM family protein phosphatase
MAAGDTLCVLCAAKTDPGCDPEKQVNEDAFGIRPIEGSLFAVVCDGMGGHTGGRVASHTAVDTILKRLLSPRSDRPTRDRLDEAILAASNAVHLIGGDAPPDERPGSTCVAAWLHADSLLIAHVGDSRCYLWRDNSLRPMTRDHSVIEAWIQAGQVTREQAHQHPDAHRITRALGIESKVKVEVSRPLQPLERDRLLLCSDGLTDLVTEPEIGEFLGRPSPVDQLADELVSLAKCRGGHDNVTVVILEVAVGNHVPLPSLDPSVLSCHQLTGRAQAGNATELVALRPSDTTRAVAAEVLDRTVVMDDGSGIGFAPPAAVQPGQPQAPRLAKTQPLLRVDQVAEAQVTDARPHQPPAVSDRPSAKNGVDSQGSKRLWAVLGLCLFLVLLAVAKRLLRH